MNTFTALVIVVVGILVIYFTQVILQYRSRMALRDRIKVLGNKTDQTLHATLGRRLENDLSFLGRIVTQIPGSDKLDRLLLRSGTNQSPSKFVKKVLQVTVVLALIVGLLLQSIVAGLAAGLTGPVLMVLYLRMKSEKRRLAFEAQLPEALDFISRALRTGHGLTAAMGMVAEEIPAPAGEEFRLVFDEISFGVPFEDALSGLSERVDSMDLNFFVIATKIQQQTGGNFTEIMALIAFTIRERIKLQGKVRVLAAEGKFSAMLLAALPFLIGGALTVINPEYMASLWFSSDGQNLVGLGLIMIVLGFVWLQQIAKIKV